MRCVAVIQARRKSTRLPDKVLLPLAGKPVIQHVIERCQQIEGVEKVICAIPEAPYNDVLAEAAIKAGSDVSRGSETDVLSRYYHAVKPLDTDYVMRVTSDCPLLDPVVCGQAFQLLEDDTVDYGAVGGGWPHGMDCEVFKFSWLKKAHECATLPEDREHVTLWMKSHKDMVRRTIESEQASLHDQNRWVIDYPEDYEFLKTLSALTSDGQLPIQWQNTLAIVDATPELRKINQHCGVEWKKASEQLFQLAKERK